MKKAIIIIVCIAIVGLIILGYGLRNKPNENTQPNEIQNYGYTDFEEEEEEVKNPVIDWWKVYKDRNKQNCITVQVSNPNSFPIQFTYDLVYYKNNEAVKTETRWAMTCIDSNKQGIIYGHIEIPSPSDVDRVELENIDASKFEWKTVDYTLTKTFIEKGSQYFDVQFTAAPAHTEIWAVLYNDTNGDQNIQANEFVQMGLLAPFVGIYEEKGEIKIPMPDGDLMYTDYQIYCTAFTRENAE